MRSHFSRENLNRFSVNCQSTCFYYCLRNKLNKYGLETNEAFERLQTGDKICAMLLLIAIKVKQI